MLLRYESPVKNRYESPVFYDLGILHCYESPVRSRAFVTNRYELILSRIMKENNRKNKCIYICVTSNARLWTDSTLSRKSAISGTLATLLT
jgi:GDP-D-mannose dehydratase